MRLVIVTDAWRPQVNGVVHSIEQVVERLRAGGDTVEIVAPTAFRTIPCPTYPDIALSLTTTAHVGAMIEALTPDFVHIATEGPLGQFARRHCLKAGRPYTTSYHTRFPEYVAARFPVPLAWPYAMLRRFHNAGAGCMTATESLRRDLAARDFANLMHWPRGVDADLFRPRPDADFGLPRPVFLYVGRVAVEKNIGAFLDLNLPGSKVVVGDGPARADLEQKHRDANFLGVKRGEDLARAYASGDVFVFPSRTDTFGNVLLEALASGLPVAAYPVMGPLDVIGKSGAGVLSEDLGAAATAAAAIDRDTARRHALTYSWEASAATFRGNVLTANGVRETVAA